MTPRNCDRASLVILRVKCRDFVTRAHRGMCLIVERGKPLERVGRFADAIRFSHWLGSGDAGSRRPWAEAQTESSVRLLTVAFANMLRRWALTVRGLMKRASLI